MIFPLCDFFSKNSFLKLSFHFPNSGDFGQKSDNFFCQFPKSRIDTVFDFEFSIFSLPDYKEKFMTTHFLNEITKKSILENF